MYISKIRTQSCKNILHLRTLFKLGGTMKTTLHFLFERQQIKCLKIDRLDSNYIDYKTANNAMIEMVKI